MSGIAAIINFDGAPVEPGLIGRMTGAMAYRGPDGIAHWQQGPVALGHCMMRTTPESLEETHPLANEDQSLVLVMHGRLDNGVELRSALLGSGARLRTRSDAELVLRAYEAWGEDCLKHIDGDFAFLVWDGRRRHAFCTRDRFGMKPLLYHWSGRRLALASDVHALLALPDMTAGLNEGMVAEFLAAEWRSREETFWTGILRLEAAHSMTASAKGLRIAKYWEPDLYRTLPFRQEEDYVTYYRELLERAVKRASRSQGLLACEVSGGLDSSAVYAVAGQLRQKGELQAPDLRGYTLSFPDGSEADELDYAHATGAHIGQTVQEIAPARPGLRWYRQQAHRDQDFPGYPNGVMGLSIREAARRDGARVLLTGNGGDEWLWGSEHYYAEALQTGGVRRFLAHMGDDRRELGLAGTLYRAARYGAYPLLPEPFRRSMRGVLARDRSRTGDNLAWLTPGLRTLLKQRLQRYDVPAAAVHRHGQRPLLGYLHSPYSVYAFELEERMAAKAGIELRSPLFATDIVQFAFATPARIWMSGTQNKLLHRRAMQGVLPPLVQWRSTKASFMQTYWSLAPELRAQLAGPRATRFKDWVTPEGVAGLLAGTEKSGTGGWPEHKLWSLFGCSCVAETDVQAAKSAAIEGGSG